jgi:hypothetical protein
MSAIERLIGAGTVSGTQHVKKLAIAVALLGSLICSPVQAKTFVGVLWPMFGPLPAVGLMELVAELKTMPDAEVHTYLHQEWPNLVEDMSHLPPGTHTFVIGYSLGANATAFVANKSKYIDLIIALQPSMLSWNPPVTGKVGRMIEVYNPNAWMTFGGMGSKKLEGPNIEYIANNDSHPGAQFNSEFRNLVKTELANFTAEDRQDKDRQDQDRVQTAQAAAPAPVELPQAAPPAKLDPTRLDSTRLGYAEEAPAHQQSDMAAKGQRQSAQTEVPMPLPKPRPTYVALEQPPTVRAPKERVAFIDTLSSSVSSGALPVSSSGDVAAASSGNLSASSAGHFSAANSAASPAKRELTLADMAGYAGRTYSVSQTAGNPNGR